MYVEALARHNPGGVEPLDVTLDQFREALTRETHTLKRALTDPHLFSGIGNALPDWRPGARRSLAFASAQRRLAWNSLVSY